jgi:hypothetical protein
MLDRQRAFLPLVVLKADMTDADDSTDAALPARGMLRFMASGAPVR